jgi:hypothetical protein
MLREIITHRPLQPMNLDINPRCELGKSLSPLPPGTDGQPFPMLTPTPSCCSFPSGSTVPLLRYQLSVAQTTVPRTGSGAVIQMASRLSCADCLFSGTISRHTDFQKYRSSGLYSFQRIASARGIVSGNRRVCYYFAHATSDR